MSHITLAVTEADIAVGRQCQVCPILCAIYRTTGSLWRISAAGVGHERRPPFRSFAFQSASLDIWRDYLVTGEMSPCEITIDLVETPDEWRQLADTPALAGAV
jgi:hypothetical protein